MPPTAILLILMFAVLHTAWTLLAKRAPKTAAFYAVTIFVGVLMYSVVCVPHIVARRAILGAWPFFCISGVFLAAYYVLMASVYRRADLSAVYPVLRLGPVFITAWSVIFLKEELPPIAFAGIAAIVAGTMMLPQRSLRISRAALDTRHYLTKTYGMALAASFCTSIYIVVDKSAMTRFNPEGDFRLALDYVLLEMCACCVVLVVFAVLSRDRQAWRQVRAAKVSTILMAPMVIGAYALVMGALAIPGVRAAYVAAFRQISMVLTVTAGIVLLKERFGLVRIVAAVVICAGLALMALG